MARKYTKVEGLTAVIRARKAAGETNRTIGESYGLKIESQIGRGTYIRVRVPRMEVNT